MIHFRPIELTPSQISPLILSDQLIRLAEAADSAGLRTTANRLVHLACSVFDEPTKQRERGLQRPNGGA